MVVREWTVDNAPAVDSLTYRRSECGKPGSALSFSKSQPQGVKLLSVLHCLRMQLVDFINMLVFVTVLCVCMCVCVCVVLDIIIIIIWRIRVYLILM